MSAAAAVLWLAGCATQPPAGGEVSRSPRAAPSLTAFSFDAAVPLAGAAEFAPWAALDRANHEHEFALSACVADEAACATNNLARFRRLLTLAAPLDRGTQLSLVHEYFNHVVWTADSRGGPGRDVWESLYTVASTMRGDCEDIALAKYLTLRRLGWPADDLRMIVTWDTAERGWHALLAVRDGDGAYVLDIVLGLQRPQAFRRARMIYSISDVGIYDHAPGYQAFSQRAARTAAVR